MIKHAHKIVLLSLLMLTAESGCKSKLDRIAHSLNPFGAKGDNSNPGNNPETAAPIVIDEAAEAMHASILSELKSKHFNAENISWFESRGKFEGDWVAHSPKNYWKKDASNLPSGYACKAGDTGCDSQFLRKICSSDMDCAATHTSCVPLQASITKEGGAVKSMCLGSGDALMDDYYFTLTKAKTHLEVSSLTFPSGNFRKVLVNALSVLSQRETSPTIRMIFSSLDGITPNFLNKPDKVLDALLKDVSAVGGNAANLKINLAYLSDKKVSWNHAKIVLADSYYVLQGGHNFLDPDYVKESPIFDLSMHGSGSVGFGVQKFVNALWAHADPVASNLKNDERIVPPFVKDPNEGTARVIGMGRLGSFGDLASDDGFKALLNATKKSVYFAQQDMFNDIVKLGAKPSLALPALIDAILRGVTVKVAQSSSTKFLGYGMIAPEKAFGLLLDAITKEAETRKFVAPGGITLREYLCRQIEYAPLLFNSAITIWPNGDQIGVHPKLIIADEVGFYMGSQNFYPSDLQEFGLLVSDTKTTKELIANYWGPIWEESQKKKVECK
ncbi:MAG: hypothetical protein EOP07_00995 [Proteobacteria bacterium]|nr:MAG: hypothetical protein EOP07_00995 [Pseudomonadota bacterium]